MPSNCLVACIGQFAYNIFHCGADVLSHYLARFETWVSTPFTAKVALRTIAVQLVNAFEAFRVYSNHNLLGVSRRNWEGHAGFQKCHQAQWLVGGNPLRTDTPAA